MARPSPALRFYFSFRSPYSWLASQCLPQLAPAPVLAALDYVPFWEPDKCFTQQLRARGKEFLYRPMSRAHHLYILQDIRRLARDHGLAMRWPVDSDRPWWERPHMAYLAASRIGLGAACRDAIYRARWQRGEDICDPAVIARVAGEIGVAADILLMAPDDPAVCQDALAALESCIDANAFGVPYFVAGRESFWGSDRIDPFLRSARKLLGLNLSMDQNCGQ